jgi:hypothetical protein
MDKEVKIQIAIMYHYLKQSMDESQALLYMLSLIFYRTYSELMDQELSVFVEQPYRELGDNSRIVNKGIGTDLQLYIPLPSQLNASQSFGNPQQVAQPKLNNLYVLSSC